MDEYSYPIDSYSCYKQCPELSVGSSFYVVEKYPCDLCTFQAGAYRILKSVLASMVLIWATMLSVINNWIAWQRGPRKYSSVAKDLMVPGSASIKQPLRQILCFSSLWKCGFMNVSTAHNGTVWLFTFFVVVSNVK